ncbi:hypothetical protein C8Q78DRAFT_1143559 [Trametes maxima]|nr:hypothetical protein C8Q78DRAFT_1143559 [Trametes maxima]
MPKRPRDAFDTPLSSSPPLPPAKRRYVAGSDVPGSSPSTSALSTPYTLPYFRSPYTHAVPHDSPSNPFGLNRALRALSLPRPTGFSKHIVLRMQLVSTQDSPSRSRTRSRHTSPSDLPYRVVQVPLNFSFRLLHMLLLFLFASDAHLRVRKRKRLYTRNLRLPKASSAKPTVKAEGKDDAQGVQGEGHLFEVFDDVRLYTNTYRPGVIKAGTGKLYARLSSTRERRLFPEGPPDHIHDDDVFGGGGGGGSDEPDEDDDWDWEAEDDFLLSSVWTDGPNLKKGIIYHHTPSTAIHITANQGRVPPRKGIGNDPFVFSAHGGTGGAVRIAHVAPSPPPASSSKPASRVHKGKDAVRPKTNPKGRRRRRSDFDHSDEDSDTGSGSGSGWDSAPSQDPREEAKPYADEGEEVPELGAHADADADALERWNAHAAFERFLKREAARERAMRRGHGHGYGPPLSHGERTAAVARRARVDMPSSPLKPRSGAGEGARTYAYTYGRPRAYGNADADADDHHYDHDPGPLDDALPPSSPSTLPVDIPSECDALWTDTDGAFSAGDGVDGDGDAAGGARARERARARENMRYMIELPLQTPFPAHPAVRRRVRRAEERIERQVSRGLSEMDEDEEGGEKEQQEKEKGKGKDKGESKGKGKGKQNADKPDAPAPTNAKDEAKGKQNASSKIRAPVRVHPPPRPLPLRPAFHGKNKGKGKASPNSKPKTRPGALPTPESESEGGNSDEDADADADAESVRSGSVEVDGAAMGAAPWLCMRGPEDGSSEGYGEDEEDEDEDGEGDDDGEGCVVNSDEEV